MEPSTNWGEASVKKKWGGGKEERLSRKTGSNRRIANIADETLGSRWGAQLSPTDS